MRVRVSLDFDILIYTELYNSYQPPLALARKENNFYSPTKECYLPD
jgi:hypothetical protein